MYRCSTPVLKFELETDLNLAIITDVWVTMRSKCYRRTYKMSDNEVSLNIDDAFVIVNLTQEETAKFVDGKGEAQLKFLTSANRVYPSEKFDFLIEDVLNEEFMKNE